MATGKVEEILRSTLRMTAGGADIIPSVSEGSPAVFGRSPETSRRSLLASLVRDDTIEDQSE